MKLILSSCDFRSERARGFIYANLGMPIDECRVLYFPNEKATREDIAGEKYHRRLAEFGFIREHTYVFDYYAPERFHGLEIDAIYISGGNTFGTLNRINKARFREAIVDCVRRGAVYIGGSAGAHIASVDISHVARYDLNTVGLDDCRGLGLFSGILICHYTDARADDYDRLCRECKYKVYRLGDDDSLLSDDSGVYIDSCN